MKEWYGHSDQILDIAVSRSVLPTDLNHHDINFFLLSGMIVPLFRPQMMELFVCF